MELDELGLRRAQQGDRAARRELIVCYQQRVFALLWRMLACRGREAIVEDLCQETFVRVLHRLGSFSPVGPARLSTWILTIATRLALNELSRRRPAEPLPEDLRDERPPEGERAVLAESVRRAIARLSPDHRVALILREYHELEYEEIARVLDVEVGTVKSRLARARAELKEALDEKR